MSSLEGQVPCLFFSTFKFFFVSEWQSPGKTGPSRAKKMGGGAPRNYIFTILHFHLKKKGGNRTKKMQKKWWRTNHCAVGKIFEKGGRAFFRFGTTAQRVVLHQKKCVVFFSIVFFLFLEDWLDKPVKNQNSKVLQREKTGPHSDDNVKRKT